jgi:hypothetical protein
MMSAHVATVTLLWQREPAHHIAESGSLEKANKDREDCL